MVLCYFNVVGVSLSVEIGEKYDFEIYFILNVLKVVAGLLLEFILFGDDYLIVDGICVCDFIYVDDLVIGYFVVVDWFVFGVESFVCNFGMGEGIFVK